MSIQYNNLKLYRKQNDLTQEQVAEKLGVSRQAVAKWERGESLPDLEHVIAMADMYGVTIDQLVRNLDPREDDGPDGKKYIFGVARINSKGQITLPKKSREVFGLKEGDMVLVLGDEARGMALVKFGEPILK